LITEISDTLFIPLERLELLELLHPGHESINIKKREKKGKKSKPLAASSCRSKATTRTKD
tara:strand:- start:149 stop:328 length:180 start_codon:yes stop_codon:yes gene_type:complete